MNETPRPVLAGHRTRLAKTLGTLAAVALLASATFACAAPSLGKTSSAGHKCADLAAKAVTSGKTTAGLWKCLSPEFQRTLHTYGLDGDKAFDYPGSSVTNVSYLGAHGDVVAYDVVVSANGKTISVVLAVWVNSAGLVTNIGIGAPAF